MLVVAGSAGRYLRNAARKLAEPAGPAGKCFPKKSLYLRLRVGLAEPIFGWAAYTEKTEQGYSSVIGSIGLVPPSDHIDFASLKTLLRARAFGIHPSRLACYRDRIAARSTMLLVLARPPFHCRCQHGIRTI